MQAITREQMKEVDRLMVESGVSIETMMESASLAVADAAEKIIKGKRILVLCGHGNNGGDGLAAARHLINRGFNVKIICAKEPRAEAAKQLEKLKEMNADINNEDFNCDLIIDALLGFNLEGNPRGVFAELINKANQSNIPILAVDIPSGLDANTGKAYEPCIKAAATVTLGIPKTGLNNVGKLFLGNIGITKEIYVKLNLKNPFKGNETLLEL
ncbi:MAG: NAD(P)H-hydrate epimerase [bacterium]|nr:NAD(P)H-hydrate epimerase [bacterium]